MNAIVCMGLRGEIGQQGEMPWHLPEDLRHFKETTTGHAVIMGSRTWKSLPRRPLPGRLNIVLTSKPTEAFEVSSIEEAISRCAEDKTPFIIGGAKVYADTLPLVSKIYATRIDKEFPDADCFFPEIKEEEWILTERTETMTSKTGLNYWFETYERRNNQ